MDAAHLNGISTASSLFAISAFTAGRIGVPIFLFLTGYLLLARNFDEKKIRKFWHKNWLGVLLTTEVWIVLYDIFLWRMHLQEWDFINLLKDMLFLTQVHMGHMWYMPMIVGVYICIPFAARSLQQLNVKLLYFPLVVLSLYAFGVPVVQVLLKISSGQELGFVLDLGYSGGVYGIYILLGYCIRKGILAHLKKFQIIFLGIAFFGTTVLLQAAASKHGVNYTVWYNCGLLLLCSLMVFEYFSRITVWGKQTWWNWLSRNSFGIYLVHFPFIILLEKWMRSLPLMMPVKVAAFGLLILCISMIICWIIDHFPKMSKILLYNR